MKTNNFKYIVMNKPAGYVCALKDNLHETIVSLIKEEIKGLHIVGRLDKDTTGIIVLTNDGKFTHNATHPKKHVEKTYEVTTLNKIEPGYKETIESGMSIDHGDTKLKPGTFKQLSDNKCLLTISEGKFHQVKKMFFALGNEVVKLHRVKFGNLNLDDFNLKSGEYTILDSIK